MGQQQLLLLVLGIVIVGLAVVVGIQAFGENQKKANADALVNDGVRIASDAQAWALKPTAFGGPTDTEDIDDVGFADLGYTLGGNGCAATSYGNLNGCFALDGSTAGTVVITGTSIPNSNNDNQVVVTVAGTTPQDITTAVTTVDDAAAN